MKPAAFNGLLLVLGAGLIISGVFMLAGGAWALIAGGSGSLGLALLPRGGRSDGR